MNRNIFSSPVHKPLLSYCVLFLALLMTGCSVPLKIQSDFVPAESLRLAQVMVIGKRADILEGKAVYEAIIAAGIKDSEVVDGSVVVARIYCCGGPSENYSSEKVNARMLFVPKEINVALGDIVEVRVGRPPEKGDGGSLNVVTRVVQKYGEDGGSCWWDPKNERLWLRILYCDWMPKEGWIKQGGINPAWYRPQSPFVPEK
jgi:hypothetical protein